jgi:2OG-Fe(II) oxygenase superfamily
VCQWVVWGWEGAGRCAASISVNQAISQFVHYAQCIASGHVSYLFAFTSSNVLCCPALGFCLYAVIKYHIGEFYKDHYDNRADAPLTRAATIIVYLDDTTSGGATSFPRACVAAPGQTPPNSSSTTAVPLPRGVTLGADGRGVSIMPVKGRAVVFWCDVMPSDAMCGISRGLYQQ